MVRTVGIAGAAFLLVYAVLSLATGQRLVRAWRHRAADSAIRVRGVYAVARAPQCRGQVRVFWTMNAAHGAAVGRRPGCSGPTSTSFRAGVPVVSPTDPIFFVSSIPLAAALYGRPEHDRPRWLFDIVLLDLLLIALFAAFLYTYFVVTIAVTGGSADLYDATSASCRTRRTCCWRCGRSGCGARRNRRRGGACSAFSPPASS